MEWDGMGWVVKRLGVRKRDGRQTRHGRSTCAKTINDVAHYNND